MNPETVALVVAALLLLGAAPGGVDTVELVLEGDHGGEAFDDALVVAGGRVAVAPGTAVRGPVYVAGGDVVVDGTVRGDVVQLAGNLTLSGSAAVEGELRTIGGTTSVAPGARVARLTDVTAVPGGRSPARDLGVRAAGTVVLALAAYALGRRRPALLANVADSVANHALVSVVVGVLASLTALALFVFMAFTLVLLPVSLLGLLVGGLTVAYGVVALGYLAGSTLDWSAERTGVATAVGVVGVQVGLELLGWVPVVGDLAGLVVLATGVGAVLLTYYGLREFEPVELPG